MPSALEGVTAGARTGIRAARRILAVLLVFSFARSQPQPSTQPSATFRTTANLVVLDAVVKDRDGKPVTNLTQDDFTVLEDGVAQTISSFESPSTKPTHTPAITTGKPNEPALVSFSPQAMNAHAPGPKAHRTVAGL
jgi:hypothetical protein